MTFASISLFLHSPRGVMWLIDLLLMVFFSLFLFYSKRKVRRLGMTYIVLLPFLVLFRLWERISQTPEHWQLLVGVWLVTFFIAFIFYYRMAGGHDIVFQEKFKRIEVPNTVFRHLILMIIIYMGVMVILLPFASALSLNVLITMFALKGVVSGILVGACANYFFRSPFW